VLRGKAVTGATGSILHSPFSVKRIFELFLTPLAAFRLVSALFSPVLRNRFFPNLHSLSSIPPLKIAVAAPSVSPFCALCVNSFLSLTKIFRP